MVQLFIQVPTVPTTRRKKHRTKVEIDSFKAPILYRSNNNIVGDGSSIWILKQ